MQDFLGPQMVEQLIEEGGEVLWQGNWFPIAIGDWNYTLLADLSGGPDVPSPIRYFTAWDPGSGSIVANSLGELLHLWNQGCGKGITYWSPEHNHIERNDDIPSDHHDALY